MNNDTLSHITLQHLSKQIQRDLLEVVDPFIGKGATEQLYQEITQRCTQHLEEFYGQYYDREQYVLRANVAPSDTDKSTLTIGWRLCERLTSWSETEGFGHSN